MSRSHDKAAPFQAPPHHSPEVLAKPFTQRINPLLLFVKVYVFAVLLGSFSSAQAQTQETPMRQACILAAGARYQVPVDLIRAVIKTEGGTTGQTVGNKNGSRDMGLMQVNTIHLSMLARYGITREMVVNDECLNIQLGTFILHRELSRGGDFWTNVGAYNSRTPEHNVRYRAKVWNNLLKVWQGR